MYKTIRNIILCTTLIYSFSSCTLETSGNGKLDGFWHLVTVDTIATGRIKDLSEERIFWSVQAKLIDYRDADYNNKECISHFEQHNNSLTVFDFYIYNRSDGDPKIEDVSYLQPYGINNLTDSFKIVELNGNNMVLESKKLILRLKNM